MSVLKKAFHPVAGHCLLMRPVVHLRGPDTPVKCASAPPPAAHPGPLHQVRAHRRNRTSPMVMVTEMLLPVSLLCMASCWDLSFSVDAHTPYTGVNVTQSQTYGYPMSCSVKKSQADFGDNIGACLHGGTSPCMCQVDSLEKASPSFMQCRFSACSGAASTWRGTWSAASTIMQR